MQSSNVRSLGITTQATLDTRYEGERTSWNISHHRFPMASNLQIGAFSHLGNLQQLLKLLSCDSVSLMYPALRRQAPNYDAIPFCPPRTKPQSAESPTDNSDV